MCSRPSAPGAALSGVPGAAPGSRRPGPRASRTAPPLAWLTMSVPGAAAALQRLRNRRSQAREAQQLGLPQPGAVRKEAPARKMAAEELPLRPPALLIGQLTGVGTGSFRPTSRAFLRSDVTQPRKLNCPGLPRLVAESRQEERWRTRSCLSAPRHFVPAVPLAFIAGAHKSSP